MTRKSKTPTSEDTPQQLEDIKFEDLSIEQQVELLATGINTFCARCYAQGVDPGLMATVLLTVYCEQMCDLGDRQTYEEQLESALEDDWEEHSIH